MHSFQPVGKKNKKLSPTRSIFFYSWVKPVKLVRKKGQNALGFQVSGPISIKTENLPFWDLSQNTAHIQDIPQMQLLHCSRKQAPNMQETPQKTEKKKQFTFKQVWR